MADMLGALRAILSHFNTSGLPTKTLWDDVREAHGEHNKAFKQVVAIHEKYYRCRPEDWNIETAHYNQSVDLRVLFSTLENHELAALNRGSTYLYPSEAAALEQYRMETGRGR